MLRPVPVALFVATTASAQHAYDVAAPPPSGFDRAAASRDTPAHLREPITLDTQKPPGEISCVVTAPAKGTGPRPVPPADNAIAVAAE